MFAGDDYKLILMLSGWQLSQVLGVPAIVIIQLTNILWRI